MEKVMRLTSLSRMALTALVLLMSFGLSAQLVKDSPRKHSPRIDPSMRIEDMPRTHSEVMLPNVAQFDDPFTQSSASAAQQATRLKNSPLKTVKGGVKIRGLVISASGWTADKKGFYEIPIDGSEPTPLRTWSHNINAGCVMADNKFYGTHMENDWYMIVLHYVYDTTSFDRIDYAYGQADGIASDMAWDATTGKIYGCFFENSNLNSLVFGQFNPVIPLTTHICELTESWHAMAFDAQGRLFAITRSGLLYQVDKETGDMAYIGNTGIRPSYAGSGCIDQATGDFYWNVVGSDLKGRIYKVNTSTAAVEEMCVLDNIQQIFGMYVPEALAEDGAPAAPENLTVDFPDGSLSGIVSFTVPAESYDGNPLSGDLTWGIWANGAVKAEGTATPGTRISEQIRVNTAQDYEIAVTVRNSVGISPKTSQSLWIGPDAPNPVANVVLSRTPGQLTLTWDPVASSSHGGYIDYSRVTYTVRRGYGGEVVLSNSSATSYTERVDDTMRLTDYSYSVEASYLDAKSTKVESNHVTVGRALTPYEESFSSRPYSLTIIDGDEDGFTWSWNNEEFCMESSVFGGNSVNDWLISPAIYLEAGSHYRVSIDLHGYNEYENSFKLYMGRTPSIEGMTIELIEETEIAGETFTNYSSDIFIEETGIYYVGLCDCTSSSRRFSLYADNLKVSAPSSNGAPNTPTSLVVVPSKNGDKQVSLSFVVPTLTNDGQLLTSLLKAEVYRDGSCVGTIANPAPGSRQTWTDTGMSYGTHTYSVAVFNEVGKSGLVEAECFVGPSTPKAPTALKAYETTTPGQVTLTWKAPVTDVNGVLLKSDDLRYTIAVVQGGSEQIIARNVTATTYTYQAASPTDEIDFIYYNVSCQNISGTGEAASSDMIPLGKAYDMTYSESFEDTSLRYKYGSTVAGGHWLVENNATYYEMGYYSQDEDDGFLVFMSNGGAAQGDFYTGKIHITGTHPELTFWFLQLPDCTNTLDVTVFDGPNRTSASVELSGDPNWVQGSVDLTDFVGKDIYIGFSAKLLSHAVCMIDNIHVTEKCDNNLTALRLIGPNRVEPYEAIEFSFEMENNGQLDTDKYSVVLYRGDQEVDRVFEPTEIASGEKIYYELFDELNLSANYQETYTAVIEMEGDQFPADNRSNSIVVTLSQPPYPTVTDLHGSIEDGCPALEWSAVSQSAVYMDEVTDSFETYESWTTSRIGDWTLIDGDGKYSGSIEGMRFGFEDKKISFFIFDGKSVAKDYAHSGKKFAASIFLTDGSQNDDWLVSPQLSGDPQMISLWACSYNSQYPESFEILYSTTNTNKESFTLIQRYENISAQWTEYMANLPKGAKYFAVRHISTDRFLFMLDDVTYRPLDGTTIDLELLGYNVYCNGEKLNSEPIADCRYVDTNPAHIAGRYVVTAVFDRGESARSNEVNFDPAGLELVTVDDVSIAVRGSEIIVTGAVGQPIMVYAPDGKLIRSATGSDENHFRVGPGIYIVKVGAKVARVIVAQ